MALSYDDRKKQYESFDNNQKQQWGNMVNNSKEGDVMRQYMDQYNKETSNTPLQTDNSANFTNANGTNGQNTAQNQTTDSGSQQNQNLNNGYETKQTYGKTEFDKDEQLDKSMFNQAPGKIEVKEGTAQETGLPDYQANTDARLTEMKRNLDEYFATMPDIFSDRNKFNQFFEYNNRESEAQRVLLDSYWKKKQDMDKASQYNTGDSIANGMKDAEITTDQLNYIKEYNNDAYREWMKKQLDEINLRIANLATPADPTDNAELFNQLVEKLNLEPGDPYQIYDNRYSTCERLGVFSDSEKLKSYQNQLDQNHSKIESIMSRYAGSTGGTVSDALAAARMQKALAPYQQREVDLQNSYTTLLNGRNSNLAIANQSANALAMQANEDQRVWNQRYQALGFAMNTASYRTPEQQAQLKLQTAQIQNDMNLLNQAQQNDLNLYNQYQTAKLNNQLSYELSDLSVEDEAQLKANLNNILTNYYNEWGTIIQRPQAQAVEDIIAYAKKNGISISQALNESFVKPLQGKAEYKQKVATDYGMLSKQTITTINGRAAIVTNNPDGTLSYQYIDDPYNNGLEDSMTVGDTQWVKYNGQRYTSDEFNRKFGSKGTAKPYDAVSEEKFSLDPSKGGLGAFLMDPKNADKKTGGQCAKFVNDYLEKIGVGRYFGTESAEERASRCNSNTPKVGTIAVFDYNHYTDGKNYGHVAIVTQVNDDGSFVIKESNFPSGEKIGTRTIQPGSTSLKGFIDFSKGASQVSDNTTINTPTLSSTEEAQKQNYLEEAKRGKLGVNDIKNIGDIAAKQGWAEEWREALKQGQNRDYSETQLKRMDSYYDDFKSHVDVVNFDKAKGQFRQLVVALNDESGVGDMSAIFTFMKTLDPTSVVREGEFAAAQNTIGDANWDAILQKLENHINGEKLTKKQREDFKTVAKEFIKIQAEAYQQQYDFLERRYKGAGIDTEKDMPPNNAQILLDSLGGSISSSNTPANSVSGLNVLKKSLNNMSANNTKSSSNTKTTLQSKYGINN